MTSRTSSKDKTSSQKKQKQPREEVRGMPHADRRSQSFASISSERSYRTSQSDFRIQEIPENRDGDSQSSNQRRSSSFKTEVDLEFSKRQTNIQTSLSRERQDQEQWATSQLRKITPLCATAFHWLRIYGGYRCLSGSHFVSDELLAEGKRRYYRRSLMSPLARRIIIQFNKHPYDWPKHSPTAIQDPSSRQGTFYGPRNMMEGSLDPQVQGEIQDFQSRGPFSNHMHQNSNTASSQIQPNWLYQPNHSRVIWMGPIDSDNNMFPDNEYVNGGQGMGGPQFSNISTTFQTDHDQRMAFKQLSIERVSSSERYQQEQWAQNQLERNKAVSNSWKRVDGGYMSFQKPVKVTDELLAEGHGGYYKLIMTAEKNKYILQGPYYGPYSKFQVL